MRKFLYLLVISLLPALCMAQYQQKTIDSLVKANAAYNKQDTNKVILLEAISSAYTVTRNPADALVFAKQALNLAEKLNSQKFIARASLDMGIALTLQNNYTESIAYKERALNIFKAIKDTRSYATTLYNIGNDYNRMADYRKGLDYFLRAYETAHELKNTIGEISSLIQAGNTYISLSDFNNALLYLFKALSIAGKINNKQLLSSCYNNIGNVKTVMDDYEGALPYYLQAQALKESLNDRKGQTITLYSIGNIYNRLKNYAAAKTYLNRCLSLSIELGAKYVVANAYQGLGNIYLVDNQYDEALQNFQRSIAICKEINDQSSLANSLIYLANVYTKTGKYEQAETALKQADAIYKKAGIAGGRKDVLENYAELYEKWHQYNKALASYQAFVVLRDSIVTADLKNQVVKKELQYEFEKKENAYQLKAAIAAKDSIQQHNLSLQQQQQLLVQRQKLNLSDKEKSLQRTRFLARQAELENDRKLQASSLQKNKLQAKLDKQVADAQIFKQNETIKTGNRYQMLLLGIALIAILISGLIFYNQYKTRKLNRVILSQKKDLEEINAVKDRMFSIVSHDMRSPVNTLMAFNTLLEDDNLTADKMKAYSREIKKTLNHTSVLMENLLNWSSSQMQGYKPELESHSLKKISDDAMDSVADRALQKGISLKNIIGDSSQVFADKHMTELIMRNILSNAIKYTPAGGVIELMAAQHAGKTTFTITDTGMGMSRDQVMYFNSDEFDYTRSTKPGTEKEKGSGLGLVLCKTLTALMNGTIAATSEIGNGSTFSVTLPQPA